MQSGASMMRPECSTNEADLSIACRRDSAQNAYLRDRYSRSMLLRAVTLHCVHFPAIVSLAYLEDFSR